MLGNIGDMMRGSVNTLSIIYSIIIGNIGDMMRGGVNTLSIIYSIYNRRYDAQAV